MSRELALIEIQTGKIENTRNIERSISVMYIEGD